MSELHRVRDSPREKERKTNHIGCDPSSMIEVATLAEDFRDTVYTV